MPAAAFCAGVISTGLIPCVSHGLADDAAGAGEAAGLGALVPNEKAAAEVMPPCDPALANEKDGAAPELKANGDAAAPVPAAGVAGAAG